MSITAHCPRGHAVVVEEPTPQAVACPRCGDVFAIGGDDSDMSTITAGLAARPEGGKGREEAEADDRPRKPKRRDDDDDRPRKPKRRDDDDDDRPRRRRPARDEEEADDEPQEEGEARKLTRKQRQLSMCRLGVLFHVFKLWIFLAAAVFFILIGFPLILWTLVIAAAAADINGAIENGLFGLNFTGIFFRILLNLAQTAAPIFGLIGSFFCFWTPPRSEAKTTAIVSFMFDALAIFLGGVQLIVFFVAHDERIVRMQNLLFLVRLICTLTAWWLFQLYLRKLAFYMHESLLASECLNVIVHFLMATLIGPILVSVTFIMAVFLGGCITTIAFFVTFGWFIYFLVTFPVRQFRLLFMVRSKIYNKFLKPDDDDDLLPLRP